jgi:hypothetical protein
MASETQAKIDGEELRAAFAISDRYILTAWHCVAEEFADAMGLWFRLRRRSASKRSYVYVPVRVTNYDELHDVAVLTVDRQRLPGAGLTASAAHSVLGDASIPLGANISADDHVQVIGYPESASSADSDTNSAQVVDTMPLGDVRGLKLQVAALAAVSPIDPHGMSGGPVLRINQPGEFPYMAVGVVRAIPIGHSPGLASGGALVATRIADVADRLPEVGVAMIAIPQARIAPQLLGLTKSTNVATVMDQCGQMLRRRILTVTDDEQGLLAGWPHFFDEPQAHASPTAIGTAYGLKLSMLIGDQHFDIDRASLITTLLRLKKPDGGWATRTGQGISRPETTALVLGALAATGGNTGAVAEAVRALETLSTDYQDPTGMQRTYVVSGVMRGLIRAHPKSRRLGELHRALIGGAIKDPNHKGLICWSSQLAADEGPAIEPSAVHTALALVALLRAERALGPDGQAQEYIDQALRWLSLSRSLDNQWEQIRRFVPNKSQWDQLVVRHFTAAWVARALLLASPDDIPGADSLLNEAVRRVWQRYFRDHWEWDNESPREPAWMAYQGACVLRDYALRTSVPL